MLVDCSLYYNESDLFAIRYAELAGVVDLFVVAESLQTFSGHRRQDFHFPFEKSPRVRYLRAEKLSGRNAWEREASLRNSVMGGLADVPPDARVMLSDADEIPRADAIPEELPGTLAYFEQDFYYYSFNWRMKGKWLGTRITDKITLAELTPQGIRARGDSRIKNGGWHFSYFGGVANIADKLTAFSHQEYNRPPFTDYAYILDHIERGEDLFDRGQHSLEYAPGLGHLPQAVQDDPERWAAHLRKPERINA